MVLSYCCHFANLSGSCFTAVWLHIVPPVRKTLHLNSDCKCVVILLSPCAKKIPWYVLYEHLKLQKQLADEHIPSKCHWEIPSDQSLLFFSSFQMNEEKSWTENSVRIANSLKAWALLTAIRFYFGKNSMQRVFLTVSSSCLIKLLKKNNNKMYHPWSRPELGKTAR